MTELLDHFTLQGPNGKHQCLVFELMGPSASFMIEYVNIRRDPLTGARLRPLSNRFPLWMAKSIILQVLMGIHTLHSRGVVHGDLQFGNVLFKLRDLNSGAEEGLSQNEAESETQVIERLDGATDPWAPKYLIVEEPLGDYVDLSSTAMVKLSDFGGGSYSFHCPFS